MSSSRRATWVVATVLAALSLLAASCSKRGARAPASLLHVSFDPTRELFADVNRAFSASEVAARRAPVEVRMSHGGSGRQSRAVLDGLDADIVSLALALDIDVLASERQLLAADWATRLPHESAPWTSTIVFVVRRGNPKGIRNWSDLVREGVGVVVPNPKTSGGARWAYLAAWGYALRREGGSDAAATAFVRSLFEHVPVLDQGARGASNTFAQNGVGDVLLTWENEAHLLVEERSRDGLEIVIPPESTRAEPPVAWVDRNVARHGTSALAERYVRFLYTEEAQEIAARRHFRVVDPDVAARHARELPPLHLFTLRDLGSSWAEIHAKHFADGAIFDQIGARSR